MQSSTPRSLRRIALGAVAALAVVAAPSAALAVAPWHLETTLTNADAPNPPGALKPWFIVPSPKGDVIYLSTSAAAMVYKLDAKTNTIVGSITMPAGTKTQRMVFDPSGHYLYAQTRDTGQTDLMYKIDTTSDTVVGSIQMETGSADQLSTLGIDPTGTALYTATYYPFIGKTDLATGTRSQISLPNVNQTYGIAFSPDGKYLYTTYNNANSAFPTATGVRRIDLSDPSSQTDWPISTTQNMDAGATQISPDGKTLYVWNEDYADLYLIDTTTGAITRTIDAGTSCGAAYCAWGVSQGLAVSPTGKYAIGALTGTPVDGVYVWLIDLTTGTSTPLNAANGFHNGPSNTPEFAVFGPETTCNSKAYIQNDPDWGNQQANPGTIDIIRAIAGPCAPTNVAVTAGSGKLDVSFTAPDDGGSPITGYEYSIDGGTTWKSTGSTGTSFTVVGLNNGTKYTVLVRAINAAAPGASSIEATGTPTAPADGGSQAANEASPKITMPAASVTQGATLTTMVSPSVAGTVKVTATMAGRTVCTATKKAKKAGRMTVTCALSPAAKAAIRIKPVTLTVTARLTDAKGKTASAKRTVKVARYRVTTPVTG